MKTRSSHRLKMALGEIPHLGTSVSRCDVSWIVLYSIAFQKCFSDLLQVDKRWPQRCATAA